MNVARSGVFLIVVEILLSSPATFVSVWGDCASDAPYAALAYFRAIDEAERVKTVRGRAAADIVLAACRVNIVVEIMPGKRKRKQLGPSKPKPWLPPPKMSRFFRTAADSDSSSSSDEEELMSSGDEAPKPVQPKTPMSRFLKTGSGSDSSSSSDDDDESDDDSEDDGGGRAAPQAKKSRFIKGGADSDSDESSDEEKRVVKSAKDKRLEELQAIGLNIENKLKIGDWVATSTGRYLVSATLPAHTTLTYDTEYDKLARLVEKRTNVSEPVPPYWIKTLLSLDASLMVTKEKDPKKKINASNAKALNGMKNKVKKASKEYEDQIKRYQEVRRPYFGHQDLPLTSCRMLTSMSASMPPSSSLLLPLHHPALLRLQRTKQPLKVKRKEMDSQQLERAGKVSSILLNPSSKSSRRSMRIVVKRYVYTRLTPLSSLSTFS